MKRKPPQWHQFDRWVFFGAFVGIALAFGLFCLVQLLVNGRAAFFDFVGAEKTALHDIISMTATAIGGLAIGGVAVMQYRKHKWAEYQAELDKDSHIAERLNKAIGHLGNIDNSHVRSGACYELKYLANDFPDMKEDISRILKGFIQSRSGRILDRVRSKEYVMVNPLDIVTAARVLAKLQWEKPDGWEMIAGLFAAQAILTPLKTPEAIGTLKKINEAIGTIQLEWLPVS